MWREDDPMVYKVIRIDEDIDFGCEERIDGSPIMAIVTLQGTDESRKRLRVEDQFLYDCDINEGDLVVTDERGVLQKKRFAYEIINKTESFFME